MLRLKNNPCAISLLLLLFSSAEAQVDRAQREQISITSSFKPSIIKTDKIEFMPSLPNLDTGRRNYSYAVSRLQFTTPNSSFLLKPLAYTPEKLNQYKEGFTAKVGYGLLSSPVASVAYNRPIGVEKQDRLILMANHSSFTGKIDDQVYSNSSLISSYTINHSSTRITHLDVLYDYDTYRTYGFDRNLYRLAQDDLRRRMSTIRTRVQQDWVTGGQGQLHFSPSFTFRHSSLWKKANESHFDVRLPATVTINPAITASSEIDIRVSSLRNLLKGGSTTGTLAQLPFQIQYARENIHVKGGVINAISNRKYVLAPEFSFSYDFGQGGVKFLAAISNRFSLNDLYSLFEINPFILVPDSLHSFRQTNYAIGFDWLSTKGIHLQMKLGIAQFRNMALFTNASPIGKDFEVIAEPLLKAYQLGLILDYSVSDKLDLHAALEAYSFYSQQQYEFAFGILPVQLNGALRWTPLSALRISLDLTTWNGAMARKTDGAFARNGGGVDLGLDVEYQLNKNWSFWVDLNNIANARYQRWNQYTCLGFNALTGVRFSLDGNR